MEQFQLLHHKSQYCAAGTRSLLLSTYIKWVNVFPEIKPQLVNVFERYRHVLDAELQQRACEFYALASRPENDDLLQSVCEEMPPFPARESALLNRLNRKHEDTGDKRVWIHGGKDANLDRQATKRKPSGLTPLATTNGQSQELSGAEGEAKSLVGLDLNGQQSIQPTSDVPSQSATAPRLNVGPTIDRWYNKLVLAAEGVLYEDIQIQIGIKSKYQGHLGQIAVYFGNKISAPLTSFTTTVKSSDPEALSVSFTKISPSTIAPRTQTQQLLQVECKKMFATPPILTVSFVAGSHQEINLRIPIVVSKFFEHVKLEQAEFFERWKLIGGPPRESQTVFPVDLTSAGELDLNKNRKAVLGHNLNLLDHIDPNPNNLVAAGVLHMSVEGKVGCLVRVEPNKDAKVATFYKSWNAFVDFSHPVVPPNRAKYIRGCRGRNTKVVADSYSSCAIEPTPTRLSM